MQHCCCHSPTKAAEVVQEPSACLPGGGNIDRLGRLAQLGERRLDKAEVTGSSPVVPIVTAIRRATPADAPDVARLLHDFNTEFDDFSPGVEVLTANAREMIAGGDMIVMLAGEGPDGFAELRFRKSVWTAKLDCYLEELYVVPALRGQGIGRTILRGAMEVARAEGATFMELGTSEDDEAARSLYESEGFTNREGSPDGPVMLFYERKL